MNIPIHYYYLSCSIVNYILLVTGHEKQTAILPQVQSPPLQFPVVPRKVASNSSKLSLNSITSINEQNPLFLIVLVILRSH